MRRGDPPAAFSPGPVATFPWGASQLREPTVFVPSAESVSFCRLAGKR